MRKHLVSAVKKQKHRKCLCIQRKHKSAGKKLENILKNINTNVRLW